MVRKGWHCLDAREKLESGGVLSSEARGWWAGEGPTREAGAWRGRVAILLSIDASRGVGGLPHSSRLMRLVGWAGDADGRCGGGHLPRVYAAARRRRKQRKVAEIRADVQYESTGGAAARSHSTPDLGVHGLDQSSPLDELAHGAAPRHPLAPGSVDGHEEARRLRGAERRKTSGLLRVCGFELCRFERFELSPCRCGRLLARRRCPEGLLAASAVVAMLERPPCCPRLRRPGCCCC